jgi:hypothetical protein
MQNVIIKEIMNLTMSLNWSVTDDLTHLCPENPSGHEKQ